MGYRKYARVNLERWLNDLILGLLAAFIGLFVHLSGRVGGLSFYPRRNHRLASLASHDRSGGEARVALGSGLSLVPSRA